MKTININRYNNIAEIILNRPEAHNALNPEMISDLYKTFIDINNNNDIRAVVLFGKGKSFCAGADLNWMKNQQNLNTEQLFEDSSRLAVLLETMYKFPKPIIAVLHGTIPGGANGLAAVCDYVVAEENTVFTFSEVKLGIIPAIISPYVIKRIGEFRSRELMISARRFSAQEAESFGLITKALPEYEIPNTVAAYLKEILSASPQAVSACKNLINYVSNQADPEKISDHTIEAITQARLSADGREGISAFFEKRKAQWMSQTDYFFSFQRV
jgi:methylglutaconyl-CoA hydratase